MTNHSRRLLKVVLIAGLVFLPLQLMILGDVVDSRSERIKAREWVAANKRSCQQLLDELANFSMNYRRAITSELPADLRATLWQEHIADFLRALP